jgi:hypothetical protein
VFLNARMCDRSTDIWQGIVVQAQIRRLELKLVTVFAHSSSPPTEVWRTRSTGIARGRRIGELRIAWACVYASISERLVSPSRNAVFFSLAIRCTGHRCLLVALSIEVVRGFHRLSGAAVRLIYAIDVNEGSRVASGHPSNSRCLRVGDMARPVRTTATNSP